MRACSFGSHIECRSSDESIFDTTGVWVALVRRLDSWTYPDPELHFCCDGERTIGIIWGQDVEVDCTGDGLIHEYTWSDFDGGTGSR